MPLPKQMQMRPIRHRRRRAHLHHHHPPTRASRLVRPFVPRSPSSPSTVHLHARVRLSVMSSSFIHSFPSSGRATCPTDRDGGAHTRVFCVPCPTDRPAREPAGGRSDDRLGGRSDDRSCRSRRVVSHSDESLLVVKAHPPTTTPRDESSGDPGAMDRIGSDRSMDRIGWRE